jgi:hypothetical protein
MLRQRILSGTVLAGLLASSAPATITSFDIFLTGDFQQMSGAQPTTAHNYRFDTRIFSDTDGGVTAGAISTPESGSRILGPTSLRHVSYADGGYATQSDLMAVYGPGDYTAENTAGTDNIGAGIVTLPEADFPDQVPYFTGNSYDDLVNASTADAVSLTWNDFDTNAAIYEVVFLLIYNHTTNTYVFEGSGNSGDYMGQSFDAGFFESGNQYSATLFFSSRVTETTGFDGAYGLGAFDYATQVDWTAPPVPEPATLAVLGLGALALRRRKR